MLMYPATGLLLLLTSTMHAEANASVPPLQFPVMENMKYVCTYTYNRASTGILFQSYHYTYMHTWLFYNRILI